MSRYTWATARDGRVAVSFDGGLPSVPTLQLDAPGVRVAWDRTQRWAFLARRFGLLNRIRPAHILGVIFAESRGDESATSADGGVGLMQITDPGLKAKVEEGESLSDPRVNVRIGAGALAAALRAHNGDLPRAAATYNAGSVRPGPEPWGMVASPGYLDRVVAAANTYRTPRDSAAALAAVAAAVVVLLGWR